MEKLYTVRKTRPGADSGSYHELLIAKLVSSVQSLDHVWLFVIPWTAACQGSLSITKSWSSLRLTSIESVMPSSHLILCHPFLLLPPVPPASESFPMSQLFLWGGQSTEVSALASVLPKNTQDFRMDWLDLLAIQGTLKSLLQQHSSKASILRYSAFFTVQLSHSYQLDKWMNWIQLIYYLLLIRHY